MSDITVKLSLECTPDDAEHILRVYSILNSSRILGDFDVLDLPYTTYSLGKTLRYLKEYLWDLCEDNRIRAEFLDGDSSGIIKEWLGQHD